MGLDEVKYVDPFKEVYTVNNTDGYIVWRIGTGWNIELLHLRAYQPGNGAGTRLFREMLSRIEQSGQRPYATVYGFTRTTNYPAKKFYQSLGFSLSYVSGVYADGDAVVFSQSYERLIATYLKGAYDGGNTGHADTR